MTGTAQSTISDIENGVVSVSLDVYLRLLEALGAELSATDRLADLGVSSREIVNALPEQLGLLALPVLERGDGSSAVQG